MTGGGVRMWAEAMLGAWALLLVVPDGAQAWGPAGHALVTRAALAASPRLPPWFRGAEDELVELSNVPDQWRAVEKEVPALVARAPDHFFDLDIWGAERVPADRWAFV